MSIFSTLPPSKIFSAFDINFFTLGWNSHWFYRKLQEIKDQKVEVVKKQRYEKAAQLRDIEKKTENELLEAQIKWEEEVKSHKELVTENNVAEVISMMTGIPIKRIAEKESSKLSLMVDQLKENVIGQDEAVHKIVKAIKTKKLKVQSSINGQMIKVSGSKRDTLQETIEFLKKEFPALPLTFDNFRD